jgi:hypothetical protein
MKKLVFIFSLLLLISSFPFELKITLAETIIVQNNNIKS